MQTDREILTDRDADWRMICENVSLYLVTSHSACHFDYENVFIDVCNFISDRFI